MFLQGSRVGRYVILELLRQRGSGVVYKAYDRKLGRNVAIKLIDISKEKETAVHMLQEAQALAKLSHPNAVRVHDVGRTGNHLFLTMELVKGMTLQDWLVEKKPDFQEVLRVFASAGLGLAAAHQTGCVHRDFRPENIIIANDGHVKVVEFALARTKPTEPSSSKVTEYIRKKSVIPKSATQSTPSIYVAPEQLRLEQSPDNSSVDQYTFCVALYDALCSTSSLEDSLVIPRWLHKIILKGTAQDPKDRFSSLEHLLNQLALHQKGSHRWIKFFLGGVILLTAGASWTVWYNQDENLLCQGAEQKLVDIWHPTIKTKVHDAFLATGAPFASAVWERVLRAFDSYGTNWTKTHWETCVATRIRGVQSAEVLDLRMACLQDRLADWKALVGIFLETDSKVIAKAVQAAAGLKELSSCANVEYLKAKIKPPHSETIRKRVESPAGEYYANGRISNRESKPVASSTIWASYHHWLWIR